MDQHTFGGLGLMARLIDFDTDETGAGADGALSFAGDLGTDGALLGDGDLGGSAGDQGGDQGGAAAGGEPFALTQQMWEELRGSTERSTGFVNEVMQAIEQEQQAAAAAQAQTAEQQRIAGLDWTDPNAALGEIERRAQAIADQRFEQQFGPYRHLLDEVAQNRGEAMVNAELDLIAKGDPSKGVEGIGEFDRGQALLLSNAFLANGIDPQQAFRQAATITLQNEQKLRQAGVDAYLERMRAAGDAPAEPHLAGGAAREGTNLTYDPRSSDKYEVVAQQWAERRMRERANAGSSLIG